MDRNTIRIVLFIVFVCAFGATVIMTLWSYGLHAGLFGATPEKEDRYLGWMLTTVILELVIAIIMLWRDVFGLRGDQSSRELNALKSRLSAIEKLVSQAPKSRPPRVEAIQCSACGAQITNIDTSAPGSRDVACSRCLTRTRVRVNGAGEITTSRII